MIPEADAPLPGLRNEGLFATHELQRGLPMKGAQWSDARTMEFSFSSTILAVPFSLQ